MRYLFVLLTIITFSYNVKAESSPSWNTIEVSYMKADIEELGAVDPDGYGIAGSYLITEEFLLLADFSMLEDDVLGVDLELDRQTLGVGYLMELTSSTDFMVGLSFVDYELCGSGFGASACVDEDGYEFSAALKSRITDNLELTVGADRLDLDNEVSVSVSYSVRYFFTDNFSAGLGYSRAAESPTEGAINTTSLSVAYHF